MIALRRFRAADAPACAALFHRAVHEGAAAHYTPDQREAWAPSGHRAPGAGINFAARLAQQLTWVAAEGGTIEGFFSLRRDGYLDLAYVAPEHMGTGLAGRLCDRVEAEARARGLTCLTTEASRLARPFLARRGWRLDAAQQVLRNGVELPNFRMSKTLRTARSPT